MIVEITLKHDDGKVIMTRKFNPLITPVMKCVTHIGTGPIIDGPLRIWGVRAHLIEESQEHRNFMRVLGKSAL